MLSVKLTGGSDVFKKGLTSDYRSTGKNLAQRISILTYIFTLNLEFLKRQSEYKVWSFIFFTNK
jgi:hypothetical protein